MRIGINVAAVALVLLATAPAFAHGGMGHMGGNMSGNMGNNMGTVGHQTVMHSHDRDHYKWQSTKTTKTIDKTHTRLRTVKFRKLVRIERELRRLRLELIKLKLEGRGHSFEARRILFRFVELKKLIAS